MNRLFNQYERRIFLFLLLAVGIGALIDIRNDYGQGSSSRHILIEAAIAFLSLAGALRLWLNYLAAKKEVLDLTQDLKISTAEVTRWKEESKKHVEGLSAVIDAQLVRWGLTSSEKEVALLLLKGLSHKEIASIRNTSEGSARQQALSVYQKSKLSGRSELSAFFLEDLLTPVK